MDVDTDEFSALTKRVSETERRLADHAEQLRRLRAESEVSRILARAGAMPPAGHRRQGRHLRVVTGVAFALVTGGAAAALMMAAPSGVRAGYGSPAPAAVGRAPARPWRPGSPLPGRQLFTPVAVRHAIRHRAGGQPVAVPSPTLMPTVPVSAPAPLPSPTATVPGPVPSPVPVPSPTATGPEDGSVPPVCDVKPWLPACVALP